MSGVWGTITDSDWTDDDARVVCRKLGHFRPGIYFYCIAQMQTSVLFTVFDIISTSGDTQPAAPLSLLALLSPSSPVWVCT